MTKTTRGGRRKLEPRRKPGPRAEDNVRFLLEAAARVLAEDGWEKLSTNRVAKAAGVSVGTLYHYYPNREAIVRALIHRIWDDELAAMLSLVSGGPPTFAAIIDAYVEHIARQPTLHAEWSTYAMHVAAADAIAWDDKATDMLVAVFDAHYEDHPRKRVVCENLFVCCVQLVRRAALRRPAQLTDGTAARELKALAAGYLAPFSLRPR